MAARKKARKAKRGRKAHRGSKKTARASQARTRYVTSKRLLGGPSNIEKFVARVSKSHRLKRYVVIAAKVSRSHDGPLFTYVGTASSSSEGLDLAARKSRRTEFIVFDRTRVTWRRTTIPRAR